MGIESEPSGAMGTSVSVVARAASVSGEGIRFDLGYKPNFAGGESMTKPNEIKFTPVGPDSIGVGSLKFAPAQSEQALTAVPQAFIEAFEEPVTIPRPAVLEPEPTRFLPGVLLATKAVDAVQIHRSSQAEVKPKEEGVTEPSIKHEVAASHQEEIEVVETVKVSREPENREGEDTSEEESRRKILLVKDKPTLQRRIDRFKKAFKAALGVIGFAQKVDQSDPLLLSGIVQPYGPDGSLEETVKELNSGTFASEDKVVEIVLKHIPVTEGSPIEEPATEEERNKVTRHRIFKPPLLLEIIKRRIKKIPAHGFGGERVLQKTENNLEDLGLQEVFPKAA